MAAQPPRPKAPPLTALRAFEAAGRLGGFTPAARELGVTPAAVTAHLKTLEQALGEAESVKLAWKPNLSVEVDEATAQTLFKLIDTLDDDDDVQTVWGNYDVSDEVMAKLG